ncbi:hypothetical protein NQ315_014191 [Exocentrus adspersus]|uniref:Protein lethal(2)denticleless n=1 Tax=Exocentrus adspersus TaxID=1586481 RepID=A0AAV8VBI3_9CUCU|nr:hypothetical protein NQ315_014191 [Exocentrus adspersus]
MPVNVPVNNVKAMLNQQYGFSTWRSLDTAIKRLRCTKENFFTHLMPALENEDFYRDTPIFACKFSPQEGNEQFVALANEDGKLAIHDSSNNNRYGTLAHNNAIFDLAWTFDQMKLVTASGDHTSKLFSVDNGEIREERVFCGHSRSVKTVTFRKNDSSVFASGGRDGNIIIWDTRTNVNSFMGRMDRTIHNSHTAQTITPNKSRKKYTVSGPSIKSVTGLVFQDENTLISCGAGDGLIKVWDLRKNYIPYKRGALPKTVIPYAGSTSRNGYSNLIMDIESSKLYANCLDNTIYCYNMNTYNSQPIMRYVGHQNNTFYVKSSLCKNGTYLISGSSDENAYIWNTKHSRPLVKLTGHTAEVTSVGWCSNNILLITCSDDMTHKIWTVGLDGLPEDWQYSDKGLAEVMPLITNSPVKIKLKRQHLLDDTLSDYTPKRICVECEICSNIISSRFCENCNVTTLKRKSTNETMNENKRLQTEFGPRRLFANVNNIISNESQLAVKSLDLHESDESQEDYEPASKIPKLHPSTSASNANMFPSPTVNLPNYVIDGVAPHISYSPPKKKDLDWLTKIRIEKSIKRDFNRTIEPVKPKTPKLDCTPKPAKCSSPRSPLLRFFKVTNNAQKSDETNCSKPHGGCAYLTVNIQPNQ